MSSTEILTKLSEEEGIFRSSVREFARNEVQPHVSRMDREMKMDPTLVKKLFELGLMGIEIPEGLGGAGSSFFMSVLAVEELSRVDPSVGVMADVQNTLVNNALLRWGSADQKARYLPRLAKDTVGAYALSEPDSGSDAFALSCRAVLEDDGYRLAGTHIRV